MESQLQQIIDVQAKQNQLLKKQLRMLKVGLLTMLLMVAVSVYGLSVLIPDRDKSVDTRERIIEHPISLTAHDTTQVQIPEILLTGNDTTQLQVGARLTVPPMSTATPIQFDFSKVVFEAEYSKGRGCDGMCF